MKFIITGTGRSGTGFTYKTLELNGFKSGHEAVFTHTKDTLKNIKDYDCDVSWLAAPFLANYDIPKFHVVRNPVKVIESWVTRKFFMKKSDPHYSFLVQHLPELKKVQDPVEQAIFHVANWSKKISKIIPEYYKLEHDIPKLLKKLGVSSNTNLYLNQKYNTNIPSKQKYELKK